MMTRLKLFFNRSLSGDGVVRDMLIGRLGVAVTGDDHAGACIAARALVKECIHDGARDDDFAVVGNVLEKTADAMPWAKRLMFYYHVLSALEMAPRCSPVAHMNSRFYQLAYEVTAAKTDEDPVTLLQLCSDVLIENPPLAAKVRQRVYEMQKALFQGLKDNKGAFSRGPSVL